MFMSMSNKERNIIKKTSLKGIQRLFFKVQLSLIVTLALMLGIAGSIINIKNETKKRDQNLQNVAETIAKSPLLTEGELDEEGTVMYGYLETLKEALSDIDVISVVDRKGIRIYHSNSDLIGTKYDGNMPDFKNHTSGFYAVDEDGPSGKQRRVYAAVYNQDGDYIGVVMAIMLAKNIHSETMQMLLIFGVITVLAIAVELVLAGRLSKKVKKSLMGYEPDVFTAMYKMRDYILETLEEGIIAIDENDIIQFINDSAIEMLGKNPREEIVGKKIEILHDEILTSVMKNGGKETNVNLSNADIILDRISIKESDGAKGTIGVLHNRAEYTKLMEDLSGTRYLVDSMRANNHDFTNKLHVILGLIQMVMYEEAISYIQNITMVQRETISKVMNAVNEPAVAALIIGKIARASELNVKFVLREACYYSASDMKLPSEMMVTGIGKLLDNAFDAMKESKNPNEHNELLFGIYSRPGAVLITVDDTGKGIKKDEMEMIFMNGYSTKGNDRGTGLYQIKSMNENYGGKITVESQEGVGSSFSVSFTKEI